MAVMMQMFYQDAPIKEEKRGELWNHVTEKELCLAASEIGVVWLPPFCKASEPNLNGYRWCATVPGIETSPLEEKIDKPCFCFSIVGTDLEGNAAQQAKRRLSNHHLHE